VASLLWDAGIKGRSYSVHFFFISFLSCFVSFLFFSSLNYFLDEEYKADEPLQGRRFFSLGDFEIAEKLGYPARNWHPNAPRPTAASAPHAPTAASTPYTPTAAGVDDNTNLDRADTGDLDTWDTSNLTPAEHNTMDLMLGVLYASCKGESDATKAMMAVVSGAPDTSVTKATLSHLTHKNNKALTSQQKILHMARPHVRKLLERM
jgi:hypothetical protein